MNLSEIISSISLETIIFCILGIILMAGAFLGNTSNKKLYETGSVANGIIYSVDQANFSMGNRSGNKITVRFLTKDNDWITAPVNSDFLITYTGQYKPGQNVKVIYDPTNPKNFSIQSKQKEKYIRAGLIVIGLCFFAIGVYQYFQG